MCSSDLLFALVSKVTWSQFTSDSEWCCLNSVRPWNGATLLVKYNIYIEITNEHIWFTIDVEITNIPLYSVLKQVSYMLMRVLISLLHYLS